MHRRISVLKRAATLGLFGRPSFTQWRRVAETWGEIHGDVITIRAGVAIKPGMRIVTGHEEREIISVEAEGRFLKLTLAPGRSAGALRE